MLNVHELKTTLRHGFWDECQSFLFAVRHKYIILFFNLFVRVLRIFINY